MNALKLLLRKSPKTESLADSFYANGNRLFAQKQYFQALESYNRSLCHAKPNSVNKVKGFAGRSAVYFEMKHYAHSLENIRLARIQSDFTESNSLDEREIRCMEQLRHGSTTNSDDKFNLSYTPHPRIPHLADCLELNENDKFGRYITTNRDLKPGDVIATEEPLLKFIDLGALKLYKYQRCFNCFKSNNLNLLPGPPPGN